MTDDLKESTAVGSDDARGPFSASSIVDVFKQEAQQLADNKEVYIPIKGYEKTGLSVRYHLPESGKLIDGITRKVFQEVKDTFTRNLYITMDVMAFLSDGLYVQPPEVDEPVELDPELTGMPISFDPTLANLIGVNKENPTARDVIRKLFGENDMALLAHGVLLNRWLQDTSADLSMELGEI